MPLSPEQLDNWFKHHPATDATAPLYDLVRASQAWALGVAHGVLASNDPQKELHDRVNSAMRGLAIDIDNNAPDGDDKDAAIRAVRLARNAANEAVAIGCAGELRDPEDIRLLMEVVRVELWKARWLACTAIACGGK